MTDNYNLPDFLEMHYPDFNVPVYLYKESRLVFCMPRQTTLTSPPKKYLDILFSSNERIFHCATDYGTYYGGLRLERPASAFLIWGPFSNFPFLETELRQLYKDYLVPQEAREPFRNFLWKIPQISLGAFINKLLFLNYCLHDEKLSLQDFLPFESLEPLFSTHIAEDIYQKKEEYLYNNSYEIESVVMNLIRTGNPDGFNELKLNDSQYHAGTTGPTALRNLKNNIIITTTLSTRAAIDGGLDHDTAYQLSDRLIQMAEQMQNVDSLYELLSKIGYTFAQKVYEAKLPTSSDDRMQKAIRFIQQNTNQHVTVDDVADYVGFSRSYFSTYFKREMGFSIGEFILRCKLEEARKLLQYTDKPISVISNYLCFCSQSHFQTTFKKQFGMTPMRYRKDDTIQHHTDAAVRQGAQPCEK